MRRSRRVQRRYKGSRGGIGILIPVLVVLCVIAAAVLWYVNDNMTYTREGTQIVFEKEVGKTYDAEETPIVIENEGDSAPVEVTPAQEVITEVAETDFKSIFVPIAKVKDLSQLKQVLADISQETDTIVFEVKAEDGSLAFAMDSDIARNAEVSGDDESFASAIELVREKGYNVAFYMSCFKDNEAARTNPAIAARTENKMMWRDAGDIRWISAYSENGKEYILSMIKKLASYKPCEIILSNISFPAEGKPEILFYGDYTASKQEMLSGFIADARKASGNIPLAAVYENYNTRRIEHSGQNPEDYKVFANIYVRTATTQYTLPFENAKKLFEGSECDVVPMGKDVVGEEFMIK